MKKILLLTAAALLSCNAFALKVRGEKVVQLESLEDYHLCQSQSYSGEWCHAALKDWVKAHPGDAFQAGKLTRRVMHHWTAVPFFAQALNGKAPKAGQCEDEDVRLSLASAFGLPSGDGYQPIIDQAKSIAFKSCSKQMSGYLESWVNNGSYEKKNLCTDLAQRGVNVPACQ